jgi:hypothetical protein
MRRIVIFMLFIALFLVLGRCVQVAAYPAVIVYEHGFAKKINQGRNAVRVDMTTDFTQDDEYVYSYVRAGFYSANLTWKWYDPEGELYQVTSYEKDCITIPCYYLQSLSIARTPAAIRFGTWRMELLADGFLLYTDFFTLKPVITEDQTWFFNVQTPTTAQVNVTVRIHPQNSTWSSYRIPFRMPCATGITAREADTNRSITVTGEGDNLAVDFGGGRSDGYEFVLSFNLDAGFKLLRKNYVNLTWSEHNGIHPIPQRFVINLPLGAAPDRVVNSRNNYRLESNDASRTSISFNQTISPNQVFAFSITYLVPPPTTIIPISPLKGGRSVFALRPPLLPISLGDISLWSAITSIMLLATSELLSPFYGRTEIVINRGRLRFAALLIAFIFLLTVGSRVYEIVLNT